jgi:hypothetical protein
MNKFTNIELGYSMMNATSSMAFAKGRPHRLEPMPIKTNGNWFYAMLRFTT